MAEMLRPKAGWALLVIADGAAALAAMLALPVQPLQAQGFWQPLFGGATAPSRAAAGYARQSGPGTSPYAPLAAPFGSYFSPFQSQSSSDDPAGDRGTYRTLCVRMCDGFYFPVSHATTSADFGRDAERCAASCGSEARLFYHPNASGDVETMLDLTGRAYASYPTAFRYRKALVPGCQCRPAPWSETERARHRGYAAAASAHPSMGATVSDVPPAPMRPKANARREQSSVLDRSFYGAPFGSRRSPYTLPAAR